MPGKHCWYRECRSDSRYNTDNLFNFIPFPKPCLNFRKNTVNEPLIKHLKHCVLCSKANLWCRLCYPRCGVDMKKIKSWTYICSLHFVGKKGPTKEYPDPVMYTKNCCLSGHVIEKLAKASGKHRRKQKNESQVTDLTGDLNVHDEFLSDEVPTQCNSGHTSHILATKDTGCSTETENIMVDSCSQTDTWNKTERTVETQTTFTIFPHMRRLNYYKNKCEDLERQLKEIKRTEIEKFENSLKENAKKCIFYTGLTWQKILLLFTFLGSATNDLLYWKSKTSAAHVPKQHKLRKFTPIQQLLVVLVRLRRGFLVTDLAFRFGMSAGEVSKLTTTCIQLLFLEFNNLRSKMFVSRKRISETLPSIFRKLKNIRVIVDCTELYCESPQNYAHQGNLYSQYKAHTTFKVLIGCTPNGAISYVSDVYEGAISDRDLFERCGIIDLLEPEDLVLADRGFTVNDLVQSRGAQLNIPPFLKGRDRLTAEEEIHRNKTNSEGADLYRTYHWTSETFSFPKPSNSFEDERTNQPNRFRVCVAGKFSQSSSV